MGASESSHQRIHATVRRIPRGRVASYGQIAELAGLPGQARLVGYALHALPAHTAVPWHRVVNAQGRISLPAAAGGLRQRQLLEAEGVTFRGNGRIALDRHGWRPASARGRSARGDDATSSAGRARAAGSGAKRGTPPARRNAR